MLVPTLPRLPMSDFELSMAFIFEDLTQGVTLELGMSTRFLKNLWLSPDLSLMRLNFLESEPWVPLNSLS